jgi:hypothetical protein
MDSPFASRLDSNYAATDSEVFEIKTLLEKPTSRLEELSTQIQKLSNEQSALFLFVSKHRALISPIRKLPIEILQEIFIACLPTAHNPVMSRWEPPVLLTQVCSSWRNVAHITPQLWNSIHIAIPCGENVSSTIVGRHIDRRSEAVQEWLSRSAAFPLNISLNCWGISDLDEFYDKIIDTVIRFSERWREIWFLAPYRALVPVASLPSSKVPLLKTLSFNCPPPGPTQINIAQFNPQTVCGVLKAPNLRNLWLRGYWLTQLSEDVTRLPINWSQLTILVLEATSWGACFLSVSGTYKILSLCPNLTTCQLEIGSISEDNEELPLDATAVIVSLPFLTRLSVRENTSLKRLFTLLHLPSLNLIEFHTTIYPTEQSSTSLLSLLPRFHNTIHLITDQYLTQQDIIKCLKLCPLLKSLSIRKSYGPPGAPTFKVDDAFLKLFFESSNDEGVLCPHLEDFESSSEAEFSETTLLQFVKVKNGDSTSTGLAKLKRLYVLFRIRLSDISQELELYKLAGLEATITYPLCTPFSAFGGLPGHTISGFGLPGYMPPF